MKLLVEFDVDADIIDVPQYVIDNREHYQEQFLQWLSDPSVKHPYWHTHTCADGSEIVGLCYRSDAFVEWLNEALGQAGEKAIVLESQVPIEAYHNHLPAIFF